MSWLINYLNRKVVLQKNNALNSSPFLVGLLSLFVTLSFIKLSMSLKRRQFLIFEWDGSRFGLPILAHKIFVKPKVSKPSTAASELILNAASQPNDSVSGS